MNQKKKEKKVKLVFEGEIMYNAFNLIIERLDRGIVLLEKINKKLKKEVDDKNDIQE